MAIYIHQHNEDEQSKLPALILLQKLGWEYLSDGEVYELRGEDYSNVLLEKVLSEWLKQNAEYEHLGKKHRFPETVIRDAVLDLKRREESGFIPTNQKIHEILTHGKSFTVSEDVKSKTLHYIDWENSDRNVYHVVEEFKVERSGMHKHRIPDIVLFINGIPVVVIECKDRAAPGTTDPVDQAVNQMIKNQNEDEIPRLFHYAQLLIAVAESAAKYGTVRTSREYWSVWKEREYSDDDVKRVFDLSLSNEQLRALAIPGGRVVNEETNEYHVDRMVTEQDRLLFALCNRERLLKNIRSYSIFDRGVRKTPRYQQYFVVEKMLQRILEFDEDGTRRGGVVWHTQGSGKSLSMVMLVQGIFQSPAIKGETIVVVTDRVDLDEQIYNTFSDCNLEPERAKSGKHLAEMLERRNVSIITTVIDKFETALVKMKAPIDSTEVFVLVDEGHRTQYGKLHSAMKRVLRKACFIGFTGTPVRRNEKDTIKRFGGLIDTYTINQAVDDGAVVPLLYEGRHSQQIVQKESIDDWFEKVTKRLSKEEANDLKKRYSSTDQINNVEQRIMRIAWDISEHFADNWKGKDRKAQLVTSSKATALKYKKYLDSFKRVTSEVLISGPDDREGEIEGDDDKNDVLDFWKKMMYRWGSEEKYNTQIITNFKNADDPEIIIVVDKLLTGFDAPRNTILYLIRMLKEHTLLQAIARVNRLYEAKEYGYIIDYRGVLGELDNALKLYEKLEDFDAKDLVGLLTDVKEQLPDVKQKHSVLVGQFTTLRNRYDTEEIAQFLTERSERDKFYANLREFANVMEMALSTVRFHEITPAATIEMYKQDLKRYNKIRHSLGRRFAESVDFAEYEPKIKRLLDTYVGAEEVETIIAPVNIFEKDAFQAEVDALSTDAAKADTIAHRTKKSINELWDRDPEFYKRFSELIQATIDDFRNKRISESEYLSKVRQFEEQVRTRRGDDLPARLQNNDVAAAYFRSIKNFSGDSDAEKTAELCLKIDEVINRLRIVNWYYNEPQKNKMRNELDDLLFEALDDGLSVDVDQFDEIMDRCLAIAQSREER